MGAASTVPRCAILFATPTTREEFMRAAHPGAQSDYMTNVLRGMDPEKIWTDEYKGVAEAACQLSSTAKRLKAGVYEKATLNDFAEATNHFQYIVLFAHWRGAIFRKSDLLGAPRAFCERIERDASLHFIRPKEWEKDPLVDALNETIVDMTLLDVLPEPIAQMGKKTRALGQTLCRDLLDEFFVDLTMPGNRVELFDGLYTLDEMERALWKGFSGEIDLAMCNSEALAVFIDLRRNNAVLHLHWPDLVHPLPQILKVEKTLQLMAQYGGSYIATRLLVEESE